MNRADRRTLRNAGCTCTPTIVAVPVEMWPPGATAGVFVQHVAGCDLGDQVAGWNRSGVLPVLVTTGSRCGR